MGELGILGSIDNWIWIQTKLETCTVMNNDIVCVSYIEYRTVFFFSHSLFWITFMIHVHAVVLDYFIAVLPVRSWLDICVHNNTVITYNDIFSFILKTCSSF